MSTMRPLARIDRSTAAGRRGANQQSNAAVADGRRHVVKQCAAETERSASGEATGEGRACADTSILLVFFTCKPKWPASGRAAQRKKTRRDLVISHSARGEMICFLTPAGASDAMQCGDLFFA